MTRYVGLMRAINVAHRQLPMATVRSVLTQLGAEDVATYLHSGNVVFSGSALLARKIEPALTEIAGFDVPTVTLTQSEFLAMRSANPWRDDPEPTRVAVFICPQPIDADVRQALSELKPHPDQYEVARQAVYLRVAESFRDSTLAATIARMLPEATARNIRTMNAIAALLAKK